MQPFNPNYNWETGVKQIKITEENLSQSCILCQLLRTKTLAWWSNCIKHFLIIFTTICLPYICWVDVIYLTCLVLLKSPWWLVWIFCAPTIVSLCKIERNVRDVLFLGLGWKSIFRTFLFEEDFLIEFIFMLNSFIINVVCKN